MTQTAFPGICVYKHTVFVENFVLSQALHIAPFITIKGFVSRVFVSFLLFLKYANQLLDICHLFVTVDFVYIFVYFFFNLRKSI